MISQTALINQSLKKEYPLKIQRLFYSKYLFKFTSSIANKK